MIGHSEVECLHPIAQDEHGKLPYDVQLRAQGREGNTSGPLWVQQPSPVEVALHWLLDPLGRSIANQVRLVPRWVMMAHITRWVLWGK